MIAQGISEQLIDIGSTRLNIRSMGQGTPTVILESGLGMGLSFWNKVQPEIATFTGVCAYDRAGMGKSAKGLKPRTARQMVTELHELLNKAQIRPPYIIAGHSLGGLNAQLYATTYPQEVAGLVLIDPSLVDLLPRLKALWGKFRVAIFTFLSFGMHPEGVTKQDVVTTCAQVIAGGKLPQIPIKVISAGKPVQLPGILKWLFPGNAWIKTFQDGHRSLVKSSEQAQHLIAENSNHMTIAQDALVIEAIRQLVKTVRE